MIRVSTTVDLNQDPNILAFVNMDFLLCMEKKIQGSKTKSQDNYDRIWFSWQ